ncbi:HAD family phosphatase [Rhodocytophaga aerolata]|uniref:HAD family phosphatase n=1 Tax=Rhodocytophaga aerolata TaxID=455078 RepID=A0ABT8RD58_9BACT|nr:HAD family phosphatase [Rhodocytophaga aerolata]MDO1449168.1 HAD family phosphatase [Rhodocytophaga aerolata]
MISSHIKNLLFDLGGVILNIDFQQVALSFSKLSEKDIPFIRQQIEERRLFYNHEVGKWTDAEFRITVNHMLETSLTDEQIDQAWNSMLFDIPQERIKLLKELRKTYTLYLLSNTNAIHIQEVNRILQRDHQIYSLEDLFDKTYYSHQIQLAKPSADCYQYVLKDAGILPKETLFIDDSALNIQGAKQIGIQTVHLQTPATILDIFR